MSRAYLRSCEARPAAERRRGLRRREFVAALGSGAVSLPFGARAQVTEQPRRVIVLMGVAEDDPDARPRVAAFERAIDRLAWHPGRNLRVDYRWPTREPEALREAAKEAVRAAPDVVVATGTAWLNAALAETRTLPIVFVLVSDPVENGFVASLSRPGGNLTGFSNLEGSIAGKWLETLKEMNPRTRRAAMLFNPGTTAGHGSSFLRSFEAAARASHIEPVPAPARSAAEIESAIAALGREPDSGLVVMSDQTLTVRRDQIVALAAQHRVPAIYPFRYFATSGGLMSYGVDTVDLSRRAAAYVDRILRGEKPGELPVEAPSAFELVINLNTARALGLEVPVRLLAQANEVIE